ncbi:MAG TPA: HAD family phosphatase [Tepidisphaeraceae bacterium]|nr:HAD family phosphatase [Tepidisphaeraceae bacterium]
MKCSAVIFDMDGLMLDSERVYKEVFNRAAADCGVVFEEELHEQLLGRTSQDTTEILRRRWGDEALLKRFSERSAHHYEVCFGQTPPPIKRGLIELLDFIESRGVPKVVATSTRRSRAIPKLERAGLLGRFASVTTGDQVQRGKPAPDIFLLAASTIPADPRACIVLEDSEAGVAGAHAAGMTVCMVPDLKQPCEEVRGKAQGVYESLLEVRAYLSGIL